MNEEMKQSQEKASTPETPQPEAPKTETSPTETPKFDRKDIEENKYVAALSYISILFLIPLLLKKESPFSQFHAKQGLTVFIFWCVGVFIFWFPIFGWLLALALFVMNIIAFFRTLFGEAWEIPVVKDIVKKLNI